jgi:ATPase subunit of ABC transporter with duplicated ATPase domains
LNDRIELGTRIEVITEHVEAAKWSQRAEELAKRFRAVSRSLTETVKSASSAVLNSDFEQRFKEECKALRAPEVGLAFPGRRGEAARRKTVSADHKPSKVLSEGEQKVIALADFLAEASLRKVPAPLIFDDPVSSLDYRRISEVSTRIADLATERQVIVFTHNVWLAVELLTKFESNRDACTYYRVSDEGGKGTIAEGIHPRWDTVKKTKGKINKAIQEAEAREGEDREMFIERAYSLMRTWCEVVVEEELFGGVLGRFAPNVSMGTLSNVRSDRLQAAIDAIVPIFEKACRVMEGHSQPLESLGVVPSIDDAKKDWAQLRDAREAYLA